MFQKIILYGVPEDADHGQQFVVAAVDFTTKANMTAGLHFKNLHPCTPYA